MITKYLNPHISIDRNDESGLVRCHHCNRRVLLDGDAAVEWLVSHIGRCWPGALWSVCIDGMKSAMRG